LSVRGGGGGASGAALVPGAAPISGKLLDGYIWMYSRQVWEVCAAAEIGARGPAAAAARRLVLASLAFELAVRVCTTPPLDGSADQWFYLVAGMLQLCRAAQPKAVRLQWQAASDDRPSSFSAARSARALRP